MATLSVSLRCWKPAPRRRLVAHSSWLSVMLSHFTGECAESEDAAMKSWFANAELRTVVLHDRSREPRSRPLGTDFAGGLTDLDTAPATATAN